MKFKTIFIAFNSILLFSFVFIFFMPFIMLGGDYAKIFWEKNWFLALVFFLVLLGMNLYFLLNWRLFTVLEEENWEEVETLVEAKLFGKKRLTRKNVLLLINTYTVLGRLRKITELGKFIGSRKPNLEAEFGLEFGLPYLVENNTLSLESYLGRILENKKAGRREWISWTRTLARLMLNNFEAAKKELKSHAETSRDPVIVVLSLYLLNSFQAEDTEVATFIARRKKTFRDKTPKKSWTKILEKAQDNLVLIILMKLVQDAAAWIYDE